jgi:hypothetical protein
MVEELMRMSAYMAINAVYADFLSKIAGGIKKNGGKKKRHQGKSA